MSLKMLPSLMLNNQWKMLNTVVLHMQYHSIWLCTQYIVEHTEKKVHFHTYTICYNQQLLLIDREKAYLARVKVNTSWPWQIL